MSKKQQKPSSSSTTNKRLGRGLSALFEEENLGDVEAIKDETSLPPKGIVVDISIDLIDPNPHQPRSFFDETKLQELAVSIKEHGVIEPILVCRHPQTKGRYELIAGERRWRACRLGDIQAVPCLVKEDNPPNVLEMMLIENIQREALGPIEEAQSYDLILQKKNITQEVLSQKIGKSRAHISNMIRILRLPYYIVEAINQGHITIGHAKLILKLDAKNQKVVVKQILHHDMSVRDVEDFLHLDPSQRKIFLDTQKLERRLHKSIARNKKKKKKNDPQASSSQKTHLKDVENVLREALQTKVTIRQDKNDGPGVIKIEFYNDEHLDGFIDRFV